MTLENIQNVKDFIQEIPDCKVYRFTHAVNKKVLYAIFCNNMYDDMASSSFVEDYDLIYQAGFYSKLGAQLLLSAEILLKLR